MFNFILNLTKKLAQAPEHIRDGILEKSTEYLKFIEEQKPIYLKKFGVDNGNFINDTIKKYIS